MVEFDGSWLWLENNCAKNNDIIATRLEQRNHVPFPEKMQSNKVNCNYFTLAGQHPVAKGLNAAIWCTMTRGQESSGKLGFFFGRAL